MKAGERGAGAGTAGDSVRGEIAGGTLFIRNPPSCDGLAARPLDTEGAAGGTLFMRIPPNCAGLAAIPLDTGGTDLAAGIEPIDGAGRETTFVPILDGGDSRYAVARGSGILEYRAAS